MNAQIKSVEKTVEHFQDVLKTFNYQFANITPIFGTKYIDVTVFADSDNPVNKLSIVGTYSVGFGFYRIESIGLTTRNENFFFQTLKTLHSVITNLQVGLDDANKNK